MESISGNAIVVKEVNINLVRKALKAKEVATKQQIAAETGLSLVTVGTILQHLADRQEVFQAEPSPSSGGRPAQQYRYNADFAYGLILFPYEEGESTFIHSAVVNLSGQCINMSDTKVETVDTDKIRQIIEIKLASYPAIRAIGFGHPGVLENGKITISDYEPLKGTDFIDYFSSLYKVPVIVENDVNAAVTGYAERNGLAGSSSLVYLYFPDRHPPGAGIFINGELYTGKSGFAGEVGIIPLDIIWNEKLYSSFEPLCEAITRLIMTLCGVLNPDSIVLCGSFLSEAHISSIARNCSEVLPKGVLPVIRLSGSFISDYQRGLAAQTLARLDPAVRIIRK